MPAMRISVAMCTYNGARHVREQLDSIARQHRLPDELVVFDDASTDQTVRIVSEFAREAPFPVRLEVNPVNVGSTANFGRAIAACTGDAIALCDQDDVWLEQKLERQEQALLDYPEAGLIFSDAALADENLGPVHSNGEDCAALSEVLRIDGRVLRQLESGQTLDVLLQRNIVTGATTIFRSSLRELVLPVPLSWVHDGWIALIAACVGKIVMLPEPLLLYRQHPGQQIGGRKMSLPEQWRIARTMDLHYFQRELEKFRAAWERLSEAPEEIRWTLEGKVLHQAARVAMRNGMWRLPLVLRELRKRNYARYSIGWKAVAQDLFL
jgi:glycosyltransferase involved in cell wall biosynthesis